MKQQRVQYLGIIALLACSIFLANAPKALAFGNTISKPANQMSVVSWPGAKPTVSAAVAYAMPGRGGFQTVHVRVLDAARRGMRSVPVKVTVCDGYQRRFYLAPITNAAGYTSCTFPIGEPRSGYTVVVKVNAQCPRREIETHTSYLPWF